MKRGDAVRDAQGNLGVVLKEEEDGFVHVAFYGHGTRQCSAADLKLEPKEEPKK